MPIVSGRITEEEKAAMLILVARALGDDCRPAHPDRIEQQAALVIERILKNETNETREM